MGEKRGGGKRVGEMAGRPFFMIMTMVAAFRRRRWHCKVKKGGGGEACFAAKMFLLEPTWLHIMALTRDGESLKWNIACLRAPFCMCVSEREWIACDWQPKRHTRTLRRKNEEDGRRESPLHYHFGAITLLRLTLC